MNASATTLPSPCTVPAGGNFSVQDLQFDKALITRLAGNGPRYTSYPTADRFQAGFDDQAYQAQAMERFDGSEARPLSLYVHIPFCNTICYYCGCNKIITKNRAKAEVYLDYLEREIAMQAALFKGQVKVEQLHLGGGTPTFLSDAQLTRLVTCLKQHFEFVDKDEGEYSIEIDPRKVQASTVAKLGELGFNRMSLGVQDFDPAVQEAVNRIQTVEETKVVVDAARQYGFRSISIDLIYGLPKQTLDGFATTLDTVIRLRPDRLSIYNYAHLPHLFKTQRQINEADLPSPETKLDILSLAIDKLTQAGYVYIGMDHFALPDDELAVAQREGSLHRNFQGYSTRDDIDLLALGVSGIGKIGASYSQNVRTTDEYYALLDADRLPVFRGLQLNRDDEIRRNLIQQLTCEFALDIQAFSQRWDLDFSSYFAREIEKLGQLVQDGLLVLTPDQLRVLPRGRLLIRNVAMIFDRYLQQGQPLTRYSKVI
ncbi:oxygen-independent coproporphyrinogen III oxidase [Chitinimonas naiadis]